MKIIRSFSELQKVRNQITGTLGLVPTMGALHDGHLSLIGQIAKNVDNVMVSIFVNPTQFGPNEDFAKYPRMEDDDIAKLETINNGQALGKNCLEEKKIGKNFLVDYVYLPKLKDIYPSELTKILITGELNQILEAKFRPGHFDGVATVVNILLNQTRATHAIFGEKDYQQLLVIKQMAADLSLPVKILSAETLRETDGLAMSSRNKYLSNKEREIAPFLYHILTNGGTAQDLENKGFNVQYLEKKWGRILAAAYLGNTRLIDNIPADD